MCTAGGGALRISTESSYGPTRSAPVVLSASVEKGFDHAERTALLLALKKE